MDTNFKRYLLSLGLTTDAVQIVEQIVARAAARGISLNEQTILPLALVSLLNWEKKLGLWALDAIGVDKRKLAADTERVLEDSGRPSQNQIIAVEFRASGKLIEELLDRAALIAREHSSTWIGTEHLLLAIVWEANRNIASVLQNNGVTYDALREVIVHASYGDKMKGEEGPTTE